MLGGLGYCTYLYSSAESRLSEICSKIPPGFSLEELREFAERHGMNGHGASLPDSGDVFMVEEKTYGRYGCRILLEGGRVKKAEYDFAS